MIFGTRANPLETNGRRSFAALMELYENNYIFIRRLAPDLDRSRDMVVSRVDGTPDLHMRVLERCPYTTSLLLTHCFREGRRPEVIPDLRIRIYHDARVAEVLPDSRIRGFRYWRDHAPPRSGTLEWRWEVNRFLNRWLRYCLGEGHGFAVDDTAEPALRPRARRWAN
ncbi:MAG TPA: DUF1249 domain-containing protein [Arenicellales bacterium]|nr:DUF1249 domain-containing protein [Arenicellales bacterium]